MFAHRPRRIEVVPFEIGIAAVIYRASEPDLAPEFAADRNGRSPIHTRDRSANQSTR